MNLAADHQVHQLKFPDGNAMLQSNYSLINNIVTQSHLGIPVAFDTTTCTRHTAWYIFRSYSRIA